MNILHLSDIHFGRNYPEYGQKDKFDDKEKILEELIELIAGIDKKMQLEHIVVTGDIAWWGKKKDFDEALEWFQRLLKATGLTGKNITFCVGNHDVNRTYASGHKDLSEDNILEIDNLYSYEHAHEMEPPIYEYDRFCENIGMEPFVYPLDGRMEYSYSLGYKDVEFSSGNIIRLVAFNTALLSCLPNMNDDRMWIGQSQVKALLNYGVIPAKDVHYSIALFHHAERFLHPNEICEYDGRVATLPLLRDNVDLVLCGHTETGGRPVLQQQIGGGKVLTAGATYFSDEHPNAFSMIHVFDNKRDMVFSPYTYDRGWKRYKYGDNKLDIKKIEELPELGELKEECMLIVKSKEREYNVPLKRVSVYTLRKDGEVFLRIDNRKEVLRELDIECEGNISGGEAKFDVRLAPKMERSIAAMLKREEYFEYLNEMFQNNSMSNVVVRSKSGVDIYSGTGIHGEMEADKEGVELLKKIAKIEEFYDIKFYRPDDIYESDVKKIDLLIQLIDTGFTTEFEIGKIMTTNFCDVEVMKKFYNQANKLNKFCLIYEKTFYCELFEVKFSLGMIRIIAGVYHVDKEDLIYKIETFKDGDTRRCNLQAGDNFITYFVSDKKLASDNVFIDDEFEFFTVGKMELNFGFIYEKE